MKLKTFVFGIVAALSFGMAAAQPPCSYIDPDDPLSVIALVSEYHDAADVECTTWPMFSVCHSATLDFVHDLFYDQIVCWYNWGSGSLADEQIMMWTFAYNIATSVWNHQ